MSKDLEFGFLGYLTSLLVEDCIERTTLDCLGCQHGKTSPLMHKHLQFGLFDKIACYFSSAKCNIIDNVEDLYQQYNSIIFETTGKVYEDDTHKTEMIGKALDFLIKSSPSNIYYGNWCLDFNDCYVEDAYCLIKATLKPAKSRKRPVTASKKIKN